MICKLCGKEISNFGMPSHLKRTHKVEPKDYYDKYIEPNTEHKCICGKEVAFINLANGYRKYCCQNCSRRGTLIATKEKYGVTNISQVPRIKEKMRKSIKASWDNLSKEEYDERCKAISKGNKKHIEEAVRKLNLEIQQFIDSNNVTALSNLVKEYGTGFYQQKDLHIDYVKFKHRFFVKNDDVHIIEEYLKTHPLKTEDNPGYSHFRESNPMKKAEIREKVKQTCLERYGATNVFASEYAKKKIKETKLDRYGDAKYNNRNKASKTMLNRYGKASYVETAEFKEKVRQNQHDLYDGTSARSKMELTVMKVLDKMSIAYLPNKQILDTQYLDLYIPDYSVAIECNGNYWHSIESGRTKDYHLNKSIECREKNIRLIHIYEFENLDYQLYLLQKLFLGEDLYPKNDFNKNNLISNIPESTIIYKTDKYTIYGAGKLY